MTLRGWLLSGSFDRPTRTRLGCFLSAQVRGLKRGVSTSTLRLSSWATDKI
jgi:hypothetical protein